MATTPGSRRTTRGDLTGDDRDPLNPMQEPLGSMDRPVRSTSDINEVNLPPGETVRRTGNLGTSNSPAASTARSGRGFGSTFIIAAVILVAALLVALYFANDRSTIATGADTTPPVADSNSGTGNDATGSTTTPPAPQTAPGTGDAGGNSTGSGTTTPPANP